MSVHAVILPPAPLLVPGVAGGTDVLRDVRDAVRAALASLTAGGRLPLVVAEGPAPRRGRLRPSLASAGVADRWLRVPLPDGGAWPWAADLPVAGLGASVALLCLAQVLGERVGAVETVELPDLGDPAAVGHLRAGATVVVAADEVPPWLDGTAETRVLPQTHDHLPPEYRVTLVRVGQNGRRS